MVRVPIHAAAAELPRLIERVLAGEDVVLSDGAMVVVRLVPVARVTPRQPGSMKGCFQVGPAFFEPLPEEELAAWER
jgi:antitoxin (DNA-binding transcriptional repressor) of toxin-antitoxin stability system